MFGISFSELIFIMILALVVLGPKHLTIVINKTLPLIYKIKHYFYDMRNELYAKSGFHEITQIKNNIFNIDPHPQNHHLNDDTIKTIAANSHQELVWHQPELNFDKQKELFD